jgi:RNA-binding protein
MAELKGWQKQHLRSLAHHLKPVVQIGKHGLTDAFVAQVDRALDDHELIKVKFQNFKDEKDELTSALVEKTHAIFVGALGNVLILYRQQKDKDKRLIVIPQSK